jgi:uncharacterized membrane protein
MFKIMFNRLIASVLILPLLSCLVFAKIPSDWKKVKKIAGSKVVVITKARKQFEGKLINSNDDSLYIKVLDESIKLNKNDVVEVRKKSKRIGKSLAFAFGIGAAGLLTGTLIGGTQAREPGLGLLAPILGGAIGAGSGAVTGALIGNKLEKDEKEELIYIAP